MLGIRAPRRSGSLSFDTGWSGHLSEALSIPLQGEAGQFWKLIKTHTQTKTKHQIRGWKVLYNCKVLSILDFSHDKNGACTPRKIRKFL